MGIEVVTKDDLEAFRIAMLRDIERLLASKAPQPAKPWLKGSEVRKLLSLSAGKLQNLRITGKIASTKIGGTHYYRYEDIEKMMRQGQ